VSLLGVGVGARFEAVLPGGSRVSVVGSPSLTLRQHVANELFASTPTAVVLAIDRICIVSSDGATEYCTTSLSWAVVSPTFDVLAGQTVSLTMTLTLTSTHSPSVSGGLPSVSATNSSNLLGLLYLILRGARPANTYLTLEGVSWVDGAGTALLAKPLVRSYTAGATSGSASHDFFNFTSGGSLARIHVDCTNQLDCIVYTLSSALSVTMSDRARYSVSISVG
jgi:hypothetical protein